MLLYWSKINKFGITWDLKREEIVVTVKGTGDFYHNRFTLNANAKHVVFESYLLHGDGTEEEISAAMYESDTAHLFDAIRENRLDVIQVFSFLERLGNNGD
jgi:hypothetical protein